MLEVLTALALLTNSAATVLLARHAILEKKTHRNGRAKITPYGL